MLAQTQTLVHRQILLKHPAQACASPPYHKNNRAQMHQLKIHISLGFFTVLKQALYVSTALSADQSTYCRTAVSPQENGSFASHSIPLMDEECSDTDASTDKVSC